MQTSNHKNKSIQRHYEDGGEYIIHPIYDKPEQKVDMSRLGTLKMNTLTKDILIGLRIYLILGMMLLVYYVVGIATGKVNIPH